MRGKCTLNIIDTKVENLGGGGGRFWSRSVKNPGSCTGVVGLVLKCPFFFCDREHRMGKCLYGQKLGDVRVGRKSK